MLSPPALSLLTIGSFATIYTAWFNYPNDLNNSKSNKETSLFISDIILDLITIGIGAFGAEWFYINGMKLISWIISIFPIILIIGIALIIIISRLYTEKQMSVMKNNPHPINISLEKESKIRNRIAIITKKI